MSWKAVASVADRVFCSRFGGVMLAVGACYCMPALASAEPFSPLRVAADARWLIHVDLDQVRDTALGKQFLEGEFAHGKLLNSLDEFKRETGLNPLQDLRDLTLYDAGFTPDSAVALFRLREPMREELLELLTKAAPDYETFEHNGETIYHWQLPGRPQVYATCVGETDVLFCTVRATLLTAVDVLAGRVGALPADGELAANCKSGTLLLARAREINADDSPFFNHLIRDARFLSLAIGEYDREAFLKVRVVAGSADGADQIRAAAVAFKTIVLMQSNDDARLKATMEKLQVATADQTVIFDWRLTIDEITNAWTILGKRQR